jgi:dehydrogenase/reductase SDR family protein 7B
MIKRGLPSSIAVISSVQGKIGTPLRTSYAASKHAVQGYFDSLRAELSPYRIKVTVVSPGYVSTNLSLNAVNADGSNYGKMDATTAGGMSPLIVAKETLLAIARGDADVILADCKTCAAVSAKSSMPDLLAKVLRSKK